MINRHASPDFWIACTNCEWVTQDASEQHECRRDPKRLEARIASLEAALVARDNEWRDAWARCGHFQELTACDRECALRSLIEDAAEPPKEASKELK